jgi:hypothetical protein
VPRRPQRPQFPHCIPPTARQAIEILWEDPENDRDVLQRFAIHPLMYTDVWEKLPREPESMAGGGDRECDGCDQDLSDVATDAPNRTVGGIGALGSVQAQAPQTPARPAR